MWYIQNVGVRVSSNMKSIPVVCGRLSRSDKPCVLSSGVNASSASKTALPTFTLGGPWSGRKYMNGSGVGLALGVGGSGVNVGWGVCVGSGVGVDAGCGVWVAVASGIGVCVEPGVEVGRCVCVGVTV